MALIDIYTEAELASITRQRTQAVQAIERGRKGRSAPMRDGMRLRLTKIKGVTKGSAQRVLKQPYFFQCPPLEEFTNPTTRNLGSYTDYKGDEHTTPGGMAAKSITIRTLAVEWGNYVLEYNFDVERLVDDLREIVKAGYPIDVLGTHRWSGRAELHAKMFLSDVQATEKHGEPDARYLDLSFTAWSAQEVNRRSLGGHDDDFPFTIILQKDGDYHAVNKHGARRPFKADHPLTFSGIAKKAYGKPSLAERVMRAQRPTIRKWGKHTPIIKHPRFKGKGGKIIVPAPPLPAEAPISAAYEDAVARGEIPR